MTDSKASKKNGTPRIEVAGVQKTFRSRDGTDVVHALRDINVEIYDGEFICILGPSGCGKSTLLNAIAGFSRPTAGRLIANGHEVTAPGPDRAMVFQEYALFPWMTVWDNVAFGLELAGKSKTEIKGKVDALLAKLALTDFRNRFPKDLSGGMKQRVAIARCLALDSPTLLMDEPFGALDALTRRALQDELLRIWQDFKRTIVFVTHGIDESIYLADRIIVMTYRPGTIKTIVPINIPRPRDANSPEFNAIEKELTRLVMEEQMRHQKDEARATAGH